MRRHGARRYIVECYVCKAELTDETVVIFDTPYEEGYTLCSNPACMIEAVEQLV